MSMNVKDEVDSGGAEKMLIVGCEATCETRTKTPPEAEILGKLTVIRMLGVKDAGMMGEGIRAADWRAGTTEATNDMVGEVSF
jgi:hypothetical protein